MSHISVLLFETVESLWSLSNAYTRAFSSSFESNKRVCPPRPKVASIYTPVRVYAFDKDPQALEVAAALAQEDPRFTIIHASFAVFIKFREQ
jgi:16S rRNA (cytosine1402-N4)-methyltransferase